MRRKAALSLMVLCALVGLVMFLRRPAGAPFGPALMFSGFTNSGRFAVFTLTNSSAVHKLDAFLVTSGPLDPNRIGDCQIKSRTGDWLDCSKAMMPCGTRLLDFADGHWLSFSSDHADIVPATSHLTIPPHGSITVLMEVPRVGRIAKIGSVETNIAEPHSPWRAGVPCRVYYREREVVEDILAFLHLRRKNAFWFKYPSGTVTVWSGEVPR
jgi:hypothetical protein